MPRIQNGEKIVFSMNDAGKTGYPHAKKKKKKKERKKERNWAIILHQTQKLTQNGLKT